MSVHTITGDDLVRLLGSKYDDEVERLERALGEKSERNTAEYWWGFVGAGITFILDDDGTLAARWVPSSEGAPCSVPLPFGLSLHGSRAQVRERLGPPAESPSIVWTDRDSDVFDLEDCTVHVVCGEQIDRGVVLFVESAGSAAKARAQRARRNRPRGAALDALLARVARGKKRSQPKPHLADLLAASLPEDLRRFLEAQAAHDFGRVRVGDFHLDDEVTADEAPDASGDARPDRVVIGRTGGGDLWVIEWPPARETRVMLLCHDDGWSEQPAAPSLAQLIAEQADEE